MLGKSISRVLSTVAVGLAVATASAPALSGPITSLFVFGDSLSDGAGGNNANPLAPNTGGLVPGFPYDNGRFSNGKVAVEYLADGLGLDASRVFNYAIGGARTGADGAFPFTGLASQVAAFAAAGSPVPLGGGLFTIWAGANDFRDSLALSPADQSLAWAAIFQNLGSSVTSLYALGARNFLLPNLPDVGLTPEGLASGRSTEISQAAALFNLFLRNVYLSTNAQLPGTTFYLPDVFAAQHALLAASPGNGITNTTEGCLLTLANTLAGLDCNAAFFVDNIHPTTQVHAVLGSTFLAALGPNAVPEPEGLLLVASALLALTAASARRRRG